MQNFELGLIWHMNGLSMSHLPEVKRDTQVVHCTLSIDQTSCIAKYWPNELVVIVSFFQGWYYVQWYTGP
jgi:hypothetical protein